MKASLLLFIFSTGSISGFAQEYCEVTYTNDIEPITYVSFAFMNNTTSPEINGTPGHEYFQNDASLFGVANEEDIFPIILEGNTNGNHTNTFTVFIDWNENGDLNDPGEIYPAGLIINSTGTDEQQTITNITIPGGTTGEKRMRVIKHRTSTETPEWSEDPCGTYEYGQAEDYTLIVTHTDPPPCSADYPGQLENGLGNLQTVRYANDFAISTIAGEQVYANSLKINFFGNISTANIYIYEDNGGMPGALIETFENLSPISQTLIDTVFGMNVYENTFEFTPVHTGSSGDVFWLALSTVAGSEEVSNYWETSIGINNEIAYFSEDGGNTWSPQPDGLDGAFVLWGICEEMATQDNSSKFDFNYFPNPADNILIIDSEKRIESVSVYNTIGQEILCNTQIKNGKINLRSFVPGIYFFRVQLENKQIETFKIIKN